MADDKEANGEIDRSEMTNCIAAWLALRKDVLFWESKFSTFDT
eukprot:SAG11_NODE_27650_length_330_cov_1.225108_1_plen_42_part_10